MGYARIASAGLVSLALTGAAQAYCPEPAPPYCVNGYGGFSDQWEFDGCRRDVETFGRETEDYIHCLQEELRLETQRLSDEAQQSADAAIAEYERTVEDFNDRADGG